MSTVSKKLTDFSFHKRAQRCIGQTYLTNSKRPESLIKGVYPTHASKGQGCYLWDTSGKKYIDYITGLGTNLLGYANDTINASVMASLRSGNLFSLASDQEIVTAEKLKELFPFVDCFKFLKSGSDACSAAVKIARAATGRKWVLSEGYHGWHDNFVSLTEPHLGVLPSSDLCMQTLDEDTSFDDIAAIILEPVITDYSSERVEYLHALRQKCTKSGTLLIFDEIITGFRFPKFSVSRFFGVEPDLICLGKAMANGFPLAAVGGKYATLNADQYFVSSTYAGCVDALKACEKVCELLQKQYKLDELWEEGARFIKKFNSFWPEKIQIEGYPSRGVFKGDEKIKALLFQEACFAGILLGPSWWMNFPLMQKSFAVLDTLKDIIYRIQSGNVELLGSMPSSPFAQKMREKE